MHTPLKIKYPKLTLLALTFLAAYLLFKERDILGLSSLPAQTGYIGIFLAGMFFAYGFTAAPATAVFLILAKGHNLVVSGLLGGLGAMTADLIIF
ncbi:MAG: hypothetical protein QXD77_02770, partial [Candidatus Aenigmatarchaeota archaeon]